MSAATTVPADFDAYWDSIDQALAHVDAVPDLEISPSQSTEFSTSYEVRLTSTGPYRIFGFLSIPKGEGPFPALLYAPRYGSVVKPPHYIERSRYVAFSPAHRGQRLADSPYSAPYPGLLIEGIDDHTTYIYRDILADCFRAAEFITGLPEVDTSRVCVTGDDLALIMAARRPVFSAAAVSGMMFRDGIQRARLTEGYPMEEYNDYLRTHPEAEERVATTVSYYDPINHAGKIAARTLFVEDDPGSPGGSEWIDPLSAKLSGSSDRYRLTHEGATDRDAVEAWVANALGAEPHPLLWPEAM